MSKKMKEIENLASGAAPKKQEKKKKPVKITIVLLLILVLLLGTAYGMFVHFYGKMNYVGDKGQEELISTDEESNVGIEAEELTSLQAQISAEVADLKLPDNKNIYNLLLIGVDRRDKTWYGNSDSMILLSINKKAKKIRMISFMRDMYADIPGKGVRKLNAACAIGGPDLLVETIESNYKVNIDNYAYVDFDSMIALVDAVGGITLEISEAELDAVNGMVWYHCDLMGKNAEDHYIPAAGTVECDGIRAISYARIRSVGHGDYQRTERQRFVITKLMEKIRGMSLPELNRFSDAALPLVTHDISQGTLLSLLPQIPAISQYEIAQSRVPYDGLFTSQGELLVPNMTETIKKLQEEIYEES